MLNELLKNHFSVIAAGSITSQKELSARLSMTLTKHLGTFTWR